MTTHREKRLLAAARHRRVLALRDAVAGQPWWSFLPKHWRASAFWQVQRAEDLAQVGCILRAFEYDAVLFHEGVPEEWIKTWGSSR